jgi:hypothetical protein
METLKETEYLLFVVNSDTGKTKVIDIVNIHHHEVIGEIKWFSRWRQYCFFPIAETVWNPKCLFDVQLVIKQLMDERKKNEIHH